MLSWYQNYTHSLWDLALDILQRRLIIFEVDYDTIINYPSLYQKIIERLLSQFIQAP